MFEKLVPGQEIQTTVVAVNGDNIFIDLNAKSEGVVDSAEFTNENGECTVKEGDKIKVFFVGEIRGEMKFTSRIKGDKADISMVENAYKSKIVIEGHVEKEIKGGYEVKIGSNRAFCPYSQMGNRKKDENEIFTGKTLPFIITEFKNEGKNILVSNREVLEMEKQQNLADLSTKLVEGSIVEGTVKSLQKFGAFVDVQGIQTLLPISEISYEHIKDVSQVLSVGQKITAKILKADWQNQRISISLKQLQENPWNNVATKFKTGDKFDAKISKIADFGLFVTLDKGVDGLVHRSTLDGIDKNTNLKKKFNIGDELSVIIQEINVPEKRISLVPATSVEQDNSASNYLSHQNDDGETYNPFAALLKK